MDLQAEYDNRAKVPDSTAIIARWAEEAAAWRARHPHSELGLAYGPGEREKLDLFWPGPARDGPMAMFVHGGYWQALDRSWFSHLATGLVGQGVAVAIPSYDLCPLVRLGTIVEEMRAAAAFLFRRHGRRLLAIGHSAGGHLTAMLLATDWASQGLPADLVAAGLPVSGLFDLDPLRHTDVNDALGLDETEARRLSPMRLPAPGRPLHAVVGGEEGREYTRQTRGIAEAWGGSWESVPGADHFSVIEPLADPNSALVRRAVSLIP